MGRPAAVFQERLLPTFAVSARGSVLLPETVEKRVVPIEHGAHAAL